MSEGYLRQIPKNHFSADSSEERQEGRQDWKNEKKRKRLNGRKEQGQQVGSRGGWVNQWITVFVSGWVLRRSWAADSRFRRNKPAREAMWIIQHGCIHSLISAVTLQAIDLVGLYVYMCVCVYVNMLSASERGLPATINRSDSQVVKSTSQAAEATSSEAGTLEQFPNS